MDLPQLEQKRLVFPVRRMQKGQTRLKWAASLVGMELQYLQGSAEEGTLGAPQDSQ